MGLTGEESARLQRIVASIYGEGYSQGMIEAADAWGLRDLVPDASLRMEGSLKQRLDLVDSAVDGYFDLIERKVKDFREQGLSSDRLLGALADYAGKLADVKADLIANLEFAEARFDGAGHILDESGRAYEWHFMHLELNPNEEGECPVCEEIREEGPYTADQARELDYPSVPHPRCDHSWVAVPVGEEPEAPNL